MLKKRREQRTHVLLAMREVLAPMWCRKRISNPTRTKAKGRLSPSTRLLRLPTLRRRTQENALCAVVLTIGLGTARIAKISSSKGRKNMLMLLSAILKREHQGMVIILPFFQYVIYQIGGLTPGPIYMCVLISLCSLLTRS
jgi:hypothetical protein